MQTLQGLAEGGFLFAKGKTEITPLMIFRPGIEAGDRRGGHANAFNEFFGEGEVVLCAETPEAGEDYQLSEKQKRPVSMGT